MSRQFARKVEDFFRARCGAAVAGDGDMNRCPRCLGSLRVDVKRQFGHVRYRGLAKKTAQLKTLVALSNRYWME